MAILEIVMDPADVLRKKAKPVTKINASVRKLLDDMAETMYEAPGVGLAAPQVGISKRIIVLDPHDEETGLIELINPEIVYQEGWVEGPEGCLSIPGYLGEVFRYERLKVVALDRHGRKIYFEPEGWLARIFQHEIDHLDGILYTDKCSNLRESKPVESDEALMEEGETDQSDAEQVGEETAVGQSTRKDSAPQREG
jgi:peptide deformylase